MKCPHCQGNIDVQFVKAPANTQGPSANGGTGDIGEILDQILDNSLSGAAATFVAETRSRYAKYGDRIRFSEKQLSWLKSIAAGKGDDWS